MSERFDKFDRIGLVQIRDVELFGVVVLDAPDAAEVMVAIGAEGFVALRVVARAARVVVDDGLVIEIEDVERAVGTDTLVDGTEPEVAAGDEFFFEAVGIFTGDIGDAFGREKILVDDVDGRLGNVIGVIVFVRPRAAVVDAGARGGGEIADPIDLHISLLGPRHHGKAARVVLNIFVAGGVAHAAAREDRFGHDDVIDVIAVRLRIKDFAVGRDVHAPGVAAFGGNLFHGGAVGLEANDAFAQAAEMSLAVAGINIALGIIERGVNPAV